MDTAAARKLPPSLRNPNGRHLQWQQLMWTSLGEKAGPRYRTPSKSTIGCGSTVFRRSCGKSLGLESSKKLSRETLLSLSFNLGKPSIHRLGPCWRQEGNKSQSSTRKIAGGSAHLLKPMSKRLKLGASLRTSTKSLDISTSEPQHGNPARLSTMSLSGLKGSTQRCFQPRTATNPLCLKSLLLLLILLPALTSPLSLSVLHPTLSNCAGTLEASPSGCTMMDMRLGRSSEASVEQSPLLTNVREQQEAEGAQVQEQEPPLPDKAPKQFNFHTKKEKGKRQGSSQRNTSDARGSKSIDTDNPSSILGDTLPTYLFP